MNKKRMMPLDGVAARSDETLELAGIADCFWLKRRTSASVLHAETSINLISVRPEVSKGKVHRDDSIAYGYSASIPQRERK